jgi:hypothetical protein
VAYFPLGAASGNIVPFMRTGPQKQQDGFYQL